MVDRRRACQAGRMSDTSDFKRLTRSKDERMIAGVCGGVAKYLGLDPVLVRVLFVALALFGGGGLVLYVICWVLMKEED